MSWSQVRQVPRYDREASIPRKKSHLADPKAFDNLIVMAIVSESKPKEISVADLFPDLSENELAEVQKALDAYCGLALQIFTRLERERRESFDGPSADS